MDLGRQMVLLFTRLFEVHFLLIMLPKQFVSSRDTSESLHFMMQNHNPTHYIDLLSLLPGWEYYNIDNYSVGSFDVSKTNILHINRKINCNETEDVCIDTLNVIDSYVYMKGKFCLKVSKDCVKHKKTVNIISRTFKLFVPMPWKTLKVDISNIYPRFYKPVKIHCMNVNDSLIFVATNGILIINKVLKTQIPYTIECLIYQHVYTHNRDYVWKRTLQINFEPITFIGRMRRSVDKQSTNNQKRSLNQVFNQWQYYIDIKENAPVDHVIIKLNATGGNSLYSFSKNVNDKTDEFFKVNIATGEVSIKKQLDREAGTTQFTIDVTATKKSNPVKFGTATVVITVIDVNDNKPVFMKSVYRKSIKEEQPTGRFILTVQATDADEGVNKFVKYYITKESIPCPFKIDMNSGVVTNKQVLDREDKSFYSIHVKAEDQGIDPGPLSSVVTVNITVDDINDNKPIFAENQYFVSLPENTAINTIILNVTATDVDAGTNGIVEYQPLGLSEFTINPVNGEITLRQTLDYDVYRGEYDFVVVVFDRGSPPNHANVPIKVIFFFCLIFFQLTNAMMA